MVLTNRDVLEELQLMLLIKEVRVSREERDAKSLDGLPLRIEEERRTEAFIFECAYSMFYADESGKLASSQRLMPHTDQRAFELDEFKGSLRLERTGAGRLPAYVLEAHARMLERQKPAFLRAA